MSFLVDQIGSFAMGKADWHWPDPLASLDSLCQGFRRLSYLTPLVTQTAILALDLLITLGKWWSRVPESITHGSILLLDLVGWLYISYQLHLIHKVAVDLRLALQNRLWSDGGWLLLKLTIQVTDLALGLLHPVGMVVALFYDGACLAPLYLIASPVGTTSFLTRLFMQWQEVRRGELLLRQLHRVQVESGSEAVSRLFHEILFQKAVSENEPPSPLALRLSFLLSFSDLESFRSWWKTRDRGERSTAPEMALLIEAVEGSFVRLERADWLDRLGYAAMFVRKALPDSRWEWLLNTLLAALHSLNQWTSYLKQEQLARG